MFIKKASKNIGKYQKCQQTKIFIFDSYIWYDVVCSFFEWLTTLTWLSIRVGNGLIKAKRNAKSTWWRTWKVSFLPKLTSPSQIPFLKKSRRIIFKFSVFSEVSKFARQKIKIKLAKMEWRPQFFEPGRRVSKIFPIWIFPTRQNILVLSARCSTLGWSAVSFCKLCL